MDSGKSTNYWPGFVDALTNVVIAMVFVIVVLAIALSFAAQLMGRKMAEELVRAKAAVAAAQSTPAAPEVPSQATTPNQRRTDTTIAVRGRSPVAAAPTTLRAAAQSLRLEFADTALALDDDAAARLRAALAPHHADAASARVLVVATGPSMSLSDNQRTAYIRVLAVRNQLIDEGFRVEHIAVRIETDTASERPTVTVSFPAAGGDASHTP